MSFELSHHDDSPTITPTTRDVVSDPRPAFDSTGTSDVHIPPNDPPPASSGPGTKKRRPSKIAKPVRRSLSASHVRGLIMSDSESDKKRNKLGYQRISIACAHCRRRKIRCLGAEGDPHGRCQNCIRLKKDCVYYPVDQQGGVESKSQSSSKTGIATGPSSAVSSSTPPNVDPGRALDEQHDFRGFQPVPSNAPDSYSGLPVEQSPDVRQQGDSGPAGRFGGRGFDQSVEGGLIQAGPGFRPQSDSHSPWMGSGGFQYPGPGIAASHAPDYSNQQYWRQNAAGSAGDYASFPYDSMATTTASQSAHPFAFSPQRIEQMWTQQQPVRSMSYGQIEGYPQSMDQYGAGFAPGAMHQPPVMRHGPSPLELQNTSMMAPGPQSAPLRQHNPHHPQQTFIDPAHPYAMQQPPQQYHPNGMPSATPPGFSGSFYQDSPQLGSVQEEHPSPESDPYAVHPHQPG